MINALEVSSRSDSLTPTHPHTHKNNEGGGCLRCLERLVLSFNFLSPEGARALLECCGGGEEAPLRGLRHLDIFMNELTEAQRAVLRVGMKEWGLEGLECIM